MMPIRTYWTRISNSARPYVNRLGNAISTNTNIKGPLIVLLGAGAFYFAQGSVSKFYDTHPKLHCDMAAIMQSAAEESLEDSTALLENVLNGKKVTLYQGGDGQKLVVDDGLSARTYYDKDPEKDDGIEMYVEEGRRSARLEFDKLPDMPSYRSLRSILTQRFSDDKEALEKSF